MLISLFFFYFPGFVSLIHWHTDFLWIILPDMCLKLLKQKRGMFLCFRFFFLTISCNLKLWPKIYFTFLANPYSLIILTGNYSLFGGLSSSKESACPCRRSKRHGFNPWVKKILWSMKWKSIPVLLPENSMDRGDWRATAHGVTKSWT